MNSFIAYEILKSLHCCDTTWMPNKIYKANRRMLGYHISVVLVIL